MTICQYVFYSFSWCIAEPHEPTSPYSRLYPNLILGLCLSPGVYRESPVMADGIRRGGTGLAGGWGQVSRGGERRIVGRGPGWRFGGVDFLGLRGKEAGDTHL